MSEHEKPFALAHFAINALDVARAKKFYGGVFGWTFDAWGPPDFFMIETGGAVHGSLQKKQDQPFPTLMGNFECSISVDDVDRVAELIVAHGGEITLPKSTIPGIVDIARVRDPEGNTFSIARYHEPS